MPSPIAHLTAGYLVYLTGRRYWLAQGEAAENDGIGRELLLTALSFSLLPDVDSIAGLLLGDFGRYHNNGTHSLFVGAVLSLAFAAVLSWKRRRFVFWLVAAGSAYGLHVLMDAATISRGVMALWPFSEHRFLFPLPLFYGLRWSDGWLSVRHLWTLVTELAFSGAMMLLWLIWSERKGARR